MTLDEIKTDCYIKASSHDAPQHVYLVLFGCHSDVTDKKEATRSRF